MKITRQHAICKRPASDSIPTLPPLPDQPGWFWIRDDLTNSPWYRLQNSPHWQADAIRFIDESGTPVQPRGKGLIENPHLIDALNPTTAIVIP